MNQFTSTSFIQGVKSLGNAKEEIKKLYFPVEKFDSKDLFNYDFPNKFSNVIMRQDTNEVIHMCSSQYNLISNESLFTPFVDELYKRFDGEDIKAKINNRDNNRFNVSLILDNTKYDIKKGDIICPTIELKNSYNGSTSFGVAIGFHRVICSNGMMGFNKEFHITKRHKSKEGTTFDFSVIWQKLDEVEEQLNRFRKLSERRLTGIELEEIKKQITEKTLFPKRELENIQSIINREMIQLNQFDQTAWLTYHGYNNVLNHAENEIHQEVKQKIDAEIVSIIENISYN